MRTAAKVISYLFHPLLLATYLSLVLGWSIPRFLIIPPSDILTFAGLVFVMTFVFPIANLILLKAFGAVSSFEMESRRERLLPFAMVTIIYVVVAVLFFIKTRGNVNFNKVMLIVASLALVATVATIFQKVSIHSMTMGGVAGIILPLNKTLDNGGLVWPTALLLVAGGLVMSSRLYLNAHTPREVLTGAVVGFAVSFFGMLFLFG